MSAIKTAILSFGMSGRVFHAPFIALNEGFELVGICERSKTESLQFYPGIKIYKSPDEIFEDPNIELVIVNTPTYTHYEYSKKALLSGKHVVVEKAFTTSAAEAMELAALAAARHLKLSVFQNRRWDSDFKTVKKILDEDWLGEIVEAEIHFDRYNPMLSPKLHKEIPRPGSGILFDLGPHLIDQALCLFGMPESVFSDLRITRENSQVHDYFELILRYPNLRVRLKSGYFVREAFPAYVIHGKKGSFHKSRGDVQELHLNDNIKPNTADWGTEPISEEGLLHTEKDGSIIRKNVPTLQGNYAAYYAGVQEAIAFNRSMPVTAEDGIRIMRIIDAAIQSNEEQRIISL